MNAPNWKADRLKLLEQQARAKAQNKLKSFVPYERQQQFFELGVEKRERLFLGGNQTGKSTVGAYETACHLTGLYPDWWTGKRFDHPTKGWACGEGGLLVRDVSQTKLCGTPGSEIDLGTGFIPRSALLGKSAGHGVADLFDSIRVRHVSGGTSSLSFKSYDQGRTKFQGATLDFVWLDEEPSEEILSECLARLTGDGCLFATLTPLLGFTRLVNRFLEDGSPEARRDRACVKMGLRHAEHFSDEEKARRLSSYPAHERAARENGDPMLGSGAVFEEVQEGDITVALRLIDAPAHWAYLWGVDFGIGHPFAAVLIGWDRDSDVITVLEAFKVPGAVPALHASRMKGIAHDVPVAWPHDGTDREKGSGETLASLYKKEGLRMLPSHATHPDGGYSTEAGVLDMLQRMRTGRFKVASHLHDWFQEFRGYHRKDGRIVKINDDILSATRIAVMARRKAQQSENPYGAGLGANRRRQATPDEFDIFSGKPRQPRGAINPYSGRPWGG